MRDHPVRILSICDDDALRYSRHLVLESEGYAVESVSSHTPLEAAKLQSFEIAVLCHSVDADQGARLTETLRRTNASIRVLRVHAIQSWQERLYDVDCEVFPDPVPLLNAVRSLCPKTAGAIGKAD